MLSRCNTGCGYEYFHVDSIVELVSQKRRNATARNLLAVALLNETANVGSRLVNFQVVDVVVIVFRIVVAGVVSVGVVVVKIIVSV